MKLPNPKLENWKNTTNYLDKGFENISWGEKWVILESVKKLSEKGFPGGAVVKNPPANASDTGSSPGPGRSHMPRSN